MDLRKIQEELERQNKELEAAMSALDEMGRVGIAIPQEVLRHLDEVCEVRIPVTHVNTIGCPGVRV